MLRSIKHPHLAPLIRASTVTTTGAGAASHDRGGGDYSAVARNSAGKSTATRREPPIRAGIVLVQPAADVADGSFGTYDTDPSSASVVAEVLGAAGTGDDGTAYVMAVDYQNEYTDRVFPPQGVRASALAPRMIAGRISAAGAVTIGGRQIRSVSKASSVYTITFENAFGRTPVAAFVNPIAAAQKSARVTSLTASTIVIATFDSAEAAEDNAFDFVVIGHDSIDDHWGMRRMIQIAELKPRMEIFRVSGSGTAAIALGSGDATLTDNGTGDYTLTFTEAFQRAPIVVSTGKAARSQLQAAATTTACRLLAFNATGVAADDDVCVLVIGFDSADEL